MASGMSSPQQDPGFAYNLLALTSAQQVQHAEVAEQLWQMVFARTDLPAGYAYKFAPQAEPLALLAQFIQHERLRLPLLHLYAACRARRRTDPAGDHGPRRHPALYPCRVELVT